MKPINIVDEWDTKQYHIYLVSTTNHRDLDVYNPNLPRYLVQIKDKLKDNGYGKCIDDNMMTESYAIGIANRDLEALLVIDKAFRLKEEHNIPNLKHPENRSKENIFIETYEAMKRWFDIFDI